MADFQELVETLTVIFSDRLQGKTEYTHGLLGDGNGRVRVSTTPGSPDVDYVYARPDRASNRVYKVFNKRVEGQDGDPVIIGALPWEPELIQIVDLDWNAYKTVGWGDDVTTTNRHGSSHQWRDGAPGMDTFDVYRRQLGDLKTYSVASGTMNVGVSPYSLDIYGTQYQWPGTHGFSVSGAIPTVTGSARMGLVYWSPASGTTGFLGLSSGTVGSSSDATILNRPPTPQGAIPSAFVKLRAGQSSVTEFDIWDAREPFRPGISFGTGSSQLNANLIPIEDSVGFFTGTTVEAALMELPYKLVSPDGLTNPVFSVDNSGDATLAGTATKLYFRGAGASGNTISIFSGQSPGGTFDQIKIQSTVTNNSSVLQVIPDGTGASGIPTALEFFGTDVTADSVNFERLNIRSGTLYSIFTSQAGTGTLRPISIYTDGNIHQIRLSIDGRVGVRAATPLGQLHVDQQSTTAAIPALYLDQADVSEEMIEFASTIGTGNAIEAVGGKTLTTTHFIKVTLPGSLTRYIPVGTIA